MRLFGRLLMAAGLVLLPLGLYAGIVREEAMSVELTLLGAGGLLFLLGRGLAGPAREG